MIKNQLQKSVFIFCLFIVLPIVSVAANVRLLTWNIRDLGQSKDDAEIRFIAQVLNDYDVIAIQEVVAKDPRGAQAVARIADQLNRMGNSWDYRVSDPTQSPNVYMSERYAFIWKKSRLQLIGRPFLDKDLEDDCFREPYLAQFKHKRSQQYFYVVNFHARKHDDDPEDEVIHLQKYNESLKADHVFICGDFNLNESHEVWSSLYQLGYVSAIKDSPTTLKRKCKNGRYLNYPIDNIYYKAAKISNINAASVDIVESCEQLSQRRMISDHLPVFLEFSFL